MKGIILAAGVGSRLGNNMPKGLLQLPNGETILSRQKRILKSAGVDSICLVVGYKHEMIQKQIVDVDYCINSDYKNTNTAKSLLCGLENIDDDVIWLNGDVVFDREIIDNVIRTDKNTILVNSAVCGEEEVKYIADEDGIIQSISKEINNGQGEALGVNLIQAQNLDSFRKALEKCGAKDYFERGVQMLIDNGVVFYKYDLGKYRCIEVDFKEDWDNALDMFDDI